MWRQGYSFFPGYSQVWKLSPNLRAPLLAGGLFSKTEMSEVLTEILRVDPTFDKDHFLHQSETDIIPNILEVRAAP